MRSSGDQHPQTRAKSRRGSGLRNLFALTASWASRLVERENYITEALDTEYRMCIGGGVEYEKTLEARWAWLLTLVPLMGLYRTRQVASVDCTRQLTLFPWSATPFRAHHIFRYHSGRYVSAVAQFPFSWCLVGHVPLSNQGEQYTRNLWGSFTTALDGRQWGLTDGEVFAGLEIEGSLASRESKGHRINQDLGFETRAGLELHTLKNGEKTACRRLGGCGRKQMLVNCAAVRTSFFFTECCTEWKTRLW